MPSGTLIHIVPQLPPNVGGVADYAVILGRRVAEQTDGGVRSVYVQAGKKQGKAPAEALDSRDVAGRQSPEALAEAAGAYAEQAERAAVVLHYVGYGYQQRGCPHWLMRAVRQMRAGRPALRLVTMFHELYATSWKPWTSPFWFSLLQRYITSRIARRSDGLMTNREVFGEKLRAMAGGATPVRVSPTFSNVGEPGTLPAYDEREPYAVVFGGAGRKAATYGQHGAALNRALRRMDVERIVDIGTPVRDAVTAGLMLPVETCGVLPAEEVSRHLQRASVGVLRVGLHCITKSGVWAGHAAHGLPTLCIAERHPAGPFDEGKHFLLLDARAQAGSARAERAAISRRVKQWYKEHGHSRHAARALLSLVEQ
jgi:hypothetical protein